MKPAGVMGRARRRRPPTTRRRSARRCSAWSRSSAGADRDGHVSKQNLEDLSALGRQLAELLLPPKARARVAQTTAPELTLTIDDQLTRIPWELLHDGREFYGLRFAMGRVVSTAKSLAASKPRESRGLVKIALVADPCGDLPKALSEATHLGTRLGDRAEYEVVVNDRAVTRDELLAQFEATDILHVAGQVEYDPAGGAASGLRLADGRVSAADLGRLPAGATVPRMVFVTACEPEGAAGGGPGEAAVFGLASAVLMAGVKHFVGSLRAAPDSAGFQFADDFYRELAGGQSIGVAVREARRAAVRRFGKSELTWTSCVLYGDPSARYVTGARLTATPAGPAVLERKRLIDCWRPWRPVSSSPVACTSCWPAAAAKRRSRPPTGASRAGGWRTPPGISKAPSRPGRPRRTKAWHSSPFDRAIRRPRRSSAPRSRR